MVDDLKLDVEHAEAIVELGIDMEVYNDKMPDSSKDKIEAAHEIVALTIDAWTTDEVRPDSDNPQVAAVGKQMMEIFEWAGITPDKNGKLKFGPLPEIEDAESEEEDEDEGTGDETAFNVDDLIEGYSELNGVNRLAALEEAMADDGDGLYEEDVQALLEYEQELEKPNKKVIAFLEELLAEDEEGDEDEDGEEQEDEDEDETAAEGDEDEAEQDEDEEGEDEESDEPFDGYDDSKISDIKETLISAAQDEDEPLEAEQLEYVISYEKSNRNRSTLLKWMQELLDDLTSDQEPDEAEQEEAAEQPQAKQRGRKRAAANGEVSEDDLLSLVPAGLSQSVVNARLHDKRVALSGLQVQDQYEGDWPALPEDIGTVDHNDLSNLLMRFQQAFNVAHWQHTTAVIEAGIYGDVADYLEENAILSSEQSNEQKRKAEARTDDAVQAARALERQARADARRFGSMVEQLKGNVAVISRVGGFKGDSDSTEDVTPSRPAVARGSGKGDAAKKLIKR